MSATPIIEEQSERIITFRSLHHSYVAYSSLDGRLKISGTAKSRRDDLAEAFARCFLDRPGFFSGRTARRLYTLEAIEREWPTFTLRRKFDSSISGARVVEVQADEWSLDLFGRRDRVIGSIVARDAEDCALKRLNRISPDIELASGNWRIGQIVIRLMLREESGRSSSVTVRVRPDADASFKRQLFEDQVMRFLRRNGFCHDDADRTPVAAE